MIILGIDPGSRITGYGVIKQVARQLTYVDSGCIRMANNDLLATRMLHIFEGITEVIRQYQPQIGAIEQIFMHQNVSAALKLGEARGTAIAAMAQGGVTVSEYTARQIKQSIVGYGAASKAQVQYMVRANLNLSFTPLPDAADALAIALCHAQMHQNNTNIIALSANNSALTPELMKALATRSYKSKRRRRK